MKKILILSFLLLYITCQAQNLHLKVEVKKGFNVYNDSFDEVEDLQKVIDLLNKLFNTNNNAIYNSNWIKSSYFKYPWTYLYDISYYIPKNYQPILTIFNKIDANKYFLKISIIGEYEGSFNIHQMYNFLAIKTVNGIKFQDLLSLKLQKMISYNSNNITYYFKDNSTNYFGDMKKQNKFENKIVNLFQVDKLNYKYVILKDNYTLYKTIGFDYDPSMNSYIHGGLSIPSEKIIFSGNNSAYYPHELVHIYTGEYFPKIHKTIDEGIATYLGGSLGMSYNKHKKILRKVLKERNDIIFFKYLMDKKKKYGRINKNTSLQYVGGALLCDYVYHTKGINGLKILMSSGETDEELIITLEKLLDTDRDKINKLLINYLNEK